MKLVIEHTGRRTLIQIGWDTISVIVAVVALMIALLTWLFPRQPKRKPIPEFIGEITELNAKDLSDFIYKNENNIVRLRAHVPMDQEDVLSECTDEEGNVYHTLTLRNPLDGGLANGGMELSVSPEQGSRSSPIIFANGAYHINGFFLPKLYPGIFQGYVGANLMEVSAAQMALRS